VYAQDEAAGTPMKILNIEDVLELLRRDIERVGNRRRLFRREKAPDFGPGLEPT
jgi:hypothetical protein